jgi:uncharacterized protein YndB with AHSA1/START domain
MTKGVSLVLTRVLPASRQAVYRAWTDAALIRQWFCPGADMTVPEAEFDVREGGSYRIVMQNAAGETYSPSGRYEKVVPNEKLVFSWKWRDSELVTRVTVELRAISDDRTELTLTHAGFPETEIRDRHNEGWEGCLAKLPNVLDQKLKGDIQT